MPTMSLYPLCRVCLLISFPFLALVPHAQAATATDAPVRVQPAQALSFKSVLTSYRPFVDQDLESWKEANDRVGRIGGWRAYAREMRRAEGDNEAPSTTSDPHSAHQGKSQQ